MDSHLEKKEFSMMATINSQQLLQQNKMLGKFGGILRGCLNIYFFQSIQFRNYSKFFQHFWFWPPMLRMQMKNDAEVLLMQLSPIQ